MISSAIGPHRFVSLAAPGYYGVIALARESAGIPAGHRATVLCGAASTMLPARVITA